MDYPEKEDSSAGGDLAELLAALNLPEKKLLIIVNIIEDLTIQREGEFGKFQMLANVIKKRIITLDKSLSGDGHTFPNEAIREYVPRPTTRIKRNPKVTHEDGFTVTDPMDNTIEEVDI